MSLHALQRLTFAVRCIGADFAFSKAGELIKAGPGVCCCWDGPGVAHLCACVAHSDNVLEPEDHQLRGRRVSTRYHTCKRLGALIFPSSAAREWVDSDPPVVLCVCISVSITLFARIGFFYDRYFLKKNIHRSTAGTKRIASLCSTAHPSFYNLGTRCISPFHSFLPRDGHQRFTQ